MGCRPRHRTGYTYDAVGHRTTVGGTLARVSLPTALSSATYNADNQLTAWGSAQPTYDADGQMTADGTYTYTWDARGQLSQLKQNPMLPEVRAATDAAREILKRLSAQPFIDRLETALDRSSGRAGHSVALSEPLVVTPQ